MKKLFVVVLALLFSVVLLKNVNAESNNIVSGGDFEGFLAQGDGNELVFGDPAFGEGVAQGWGSGVWDSHCIAVADPLDATNTALKFSNTKDGKNFCSFFKFVSIEAGKKYEISFDYLVVGNTDNFGMRFAGNPTLEKTFYSGGSTEGWQHAEWVWETAADSKYDSIAIWFNTLGSADNVGYVDNIVVKEYVEEVVTPEEPVEVVYTFEAASSSATVVDNRATFTGDGAIIAQTNVIDLSSVYISLKYRTHGVTGIETVAYDGENAVWPAVVMPKGWNITEDVHEGFTIATANITSSVNSFTALTAIRFNVTCEAGAVLDIIDFAITTDGNHGFDLTAPEDELVPEQPEQPSEPVVNPTCTISLSGGATQEGNKFTLTSTRGYIDVNVENVDLTKDIYVSIKFTAEGIQNFDFVAFGKDAEGNDVNVDVVAGILYGEYTNWNNTEHLIGESFVISTHYIHTLLAGKGFAELKTLQIKIRGVEGNTFEIFDVAVTYDGVHGFTTNLPEGPTVEPEDPVDPNPEDPEQPSERPSYEFTAASGAEGENNSFVMTGTRAKLEAAVDAEVTAPTYVSIKYAATDIDNFDIKLYAAADGSDSVEVTVAGSAPQCWNQTELVEGKGYVILTIQTGDYLAAYTQITKVQIYVRGYADSTFVIYDFAVTADGVHGFDLNEPEGPTVDPEEPQPEEPALPTEFAFVATSGAEGENQSFVMNGTRANLDAQTSIQVSGPLYFSIKFNYSNIENFDLKVVATKEDGTSEEVVVAAGVESAWNLVDLTDYASYKVATVQSGSYLDGYVSIETIRVYVRGAEGSTFEILEFAVTKDGKHGFKLPMVIGEYTAEATKFTLSKNENNETVVSYIASPGWHTVKLVVSNYDALYDIATLTFTPSHDVNICVAYNGGYDTSIGHALYAGGETHVFTVDLTTYPKSQDGSLVLELYMDATQTVEVEKSVVLNSFVLKSTSIQDLEFTVSDLTVDYTGNAVELNIECADTVDFVIEYADALAAAQTWVQGTPTDAGTWLVKVSYNGNKYNPTSKTAIVTINKVKAVVNVDDVTVDPYTRIVTVKAGIEASLDPDFIAGEEVYDGDEVGYGAVIYYRNVGDNNHIASDVLQLTVTRPPHTHNPSENWTFDENTHWHTCDCENKLDEAAHSYDEGVVTTNPSYEAPGVKTYSCECGYSYTEELPQLQHNPAAEWSYDENNHWHACDCGAHHDEAPHSYTSVEGETVVVYTCVCGHSYTEEIIPTVPTPPSQPTPPEQPTEPDVPTQPTPEEPTEPEQPTEEESKKGCGGSVVASILGVMTLAGAVVVLRKKREE